MLGERVTLRAMEPEDLEVLYTLENDTTLWDVSSVNVPYSRYLLKQFIAKGTHDIYTDGQLRLMVESVEEGTVVGMADLVDFNPRHLRAEIGIVLGRDYRGRGFGTEVLFLMERYVQEFLHLRQLYSYVSVKNEASIKLFQKANYVDTCTLRNWLYVGNEFVDAKIFQRIFEK
ncbi:MAG: GNAT family N-acetyltransferase [Bacteroidaceae bacterium]|nr:GNAT family N-acetyltransferase [Bacteroidaceae bacterium]